MAYTHTNVANNPKALLHRLLPRNWLSIKLTTLHLILGRWWLCTAAIVLGTILVKAMNAICWWMKLTMAVISLLGRTLMCCNFLLFLSSSSPARQLASSSQRSRRHSSSGAFRCCNARFWVFFEFFSYITSLEKLEGFDREDLSFIAGFLFGGFLCEMS